ncbi:glycoside hydrolase family 127 protein [Olivibacter sp. CPCC 100613]|uniref:beta-L-arabinofuranosidase domain-containing protein n=1 Tax=Olivibacter sp. CPCC 100613 TaxID=3079931 RepID=UPI002FF4E67F
MKTKPFICFILLIFGLGVESKAQLQNRSPLRPNPYLALPLGNIQPQGWLKDQLQRMKTGLTGHLDERYPQVAGHRNGWLGGDGDAWERGPYWIDGLLPLAYILKDQALINKVKPWIEWTLNNQREDGYLGPKPLSVKPQPEAGIQKEPVEDWWPRMVMLKVLQQYYNATADKRVIKALSNYFKYQLQELPKHPLDQWTFWGNRRGADNLMVVYWLYNITGESFLLDLGNLIYQQTFPYTNVFSSTYDTKQEGVGHLYPYNTGNTYPFKQALIDKLHVGQLQSFHCVNLAQGIKTPIIYYQQHADSNYIKAVKKAFNDITLFHGQAQGMYGGDEPLHGNAPTQGIEFCSVVEMLFSLESMLTITGDTDFADQLEKIAYNAMPTQATDDFNYRQYFQSANQVLISRAKRNFFEDDGHQGTDQCYGLLTGYPCCTANMHQGWPKFVQNLWYQTADQGIAALLYGPSEVETRVANGQTIRITEDTHYPFDENIVFTVHSTQPLSFPFHLRIPHWAKNAQVKINGAIQEEILKPGSMVKINRNWKDGDQVTLVLPMHVETSRWAELSVAVARGPLVYALKIEEDWRKVSDATYFGDFWEVHPKSDWNYGLIESAVNNPENGFEVVKNKSNGQYPWNLTGAPIILKTKAKRIPEWGLYKHMAGPLPHQFSAAEEEEVPIVLVPYGCSTLRITQFPIVN